MKINNNMDRKNFSEKWKLYPVWVAFLKHLKNERGKLAGVAKRELLKLKRGCSFEPPFRPESSEKPWRFRFSRRSSKDHLN